ncbi:DUF2975 family protein [Ancylomarina subtilis]|uniref:DUF2975 family protein n=1 Tax=Ancylomarina subtilis TaxID=1639035 RepID=A0A4Q7VCD1_9BACT|nr:DUF2975 domain-containing protein [Ancylomarina subtilis]RZT93310.1 DUF2975 family protein [Ancylomarina subtilis]
MQNNYRIINFLRKLFKVFLWLSIINLVFIASISIIEIFIGSENVIDYPLKGKQSVDPSFLYDINKVGEVKNAQFTFELDKKEDGSFLSIFYNMIITLFYGLLIFFISKLSYKFFVDLQKGCLKGELFLKVNYFRIKKIGFLLLILVVFNWLDEIISDYALLRNFLVKAESVHFNPDLSSVLNIVSVLVVFVFAEIYRAGIEMKEESEYTI